MLRGLPRLQSLDVSECPVMAGPKNREKIIMLTERLSACCSATQGHAGGGRG